MLAVRRGPSGDREFRVKSLDGSEPEGSRPAATTVSVHRNPGRRPLSLTHGALSSGVSGVWD